MENKNNDKDNPLDIPFANVKSVGGIYDDDSYECGFEMGVFAARVRIMDAINQMPMMCRIHKGNLEQADLLVMGCDFVLTIMEHGHECQGIEHDMVDVVVTRHPLQEMEDPFEN